jgi:hypothetical protein
MFMEVLVHVRDGFLDELEAWRGDLAPFIQFPQPVASHLRRKAQG